MTTMDVHYLTLLADYDGNIESNTKGVEHLSPGACPGCPECGAECPECGHDLTDSHGPGFKCPGCGCEMEFQEQGGFSWSSCECCGSPLGGDRYPAHGVTRDGDVIHYDVCCDCVLYLANGDTPDTVIDPQFLPAPVPFSAIMEHGFNPIFYTPSSDGEPGFLWQIAFWRDNRPYIRSNYDRSTAPAIDGLEFFGLDTPCQLVDPAEYALELACNR